MLQFLYHRHIHFFIFYPSIQNTGVRIIVPKKNAHQKENVSFCLANTSIKILAHFAGTKPDVVIRVRRSVVQIQIEDASIGIVVEVPTPNCSRHNYAPFVAFIQPPNSFPTSVSFSQ